MPVQVTAYMCEECSKLHLDPATTKEQIMQYATKIGEYNQRRRSND